MAETIRELNPEEEVRGWIKARLKGVDTVNVTDVAREAVAEFGSDPDFVSAYMEGKFAPLVRDEARRNVAATRRLPVLHGDEVITEDEFKRRSNVLARRFSTWMEHAGASDHVRLLKMGKQQLLEAAKEREGRAERELKISRYLRKIAEQLREEEHVEDRFTPEQLADLWEQQEREEGA